MLVSHRIFDGNLTSDQEEIAEYENLLKTLPQIQITSDENVSNSWKRFYQGFLLFISVVIIEPEKHLCEKEITFLFLFFLFKIVNSNAWMFLC